MVTFNKWFVDEQIHEVIENRASLLFEILHDVQVGQKSKRNAHKQVATLLEEAFKAGKTDND